MFGTEYICDFCSDPNPRWAYPCRDFVLKLGGIEHRSHGPWAACDLCFAMIENRDQETLLERSISTYFGIEAMTKQQRATVEEWIRGWHLLFFMNRTDGPQLIYAT